MSIQSFEIEAKMHQDRILECLKIVERRSIDLSSFSVASLRFQKITYTIQLDILLYDIKTNIVNVNPSSLLESVVDNFYFSFSQRFSIIRDVVEIDVKKFASDTKLTPEDYVGHNNLERAKELSTALLITLDDLQSSLQALFSSLTNENSSSQIAPSIRIASKSFEYILDGQTIRLKRFVNLEQINSKNQELYSIVRQEFMDVSDILPKINLSASMRARFDSIVALYFDEKVENFNSFRAGALSVWPQLSLKTITNILVEEEDATKIYSAFLLQSELLRNIGIWPDFSELNMSVSERRFLTEKIVKLSNLVVNANSKSEDLIEQEIVDLMETVNQELKNFAQQFQQNDAFGVDGDFPPTEVTRSNAAPKRAYRIALLELVTKIVSVSLRIGKHTGHFLDDVYKQVKDDAIKIIAKNLLQYLIIFTSGLSAIVSPEIAWIFHAINHAIEVLNRFISK